MSQFSQDQQIAAVLAAARSSPIRNAMAQGLPESGTNGQYTSYMDWLNNQATPQAQAVTMPSFQAPDPTIASAVAPSQGPVVQAATPAAPQQPLPPPKAAPKPKPPVFSMGGGGSRSAPSAGPMWVVPGGGDLGGASNMASQGFD